MNEPTEDTPQRSIPAVHRVMAAAAIAALRGSVPDTLLRDSVRRALDEERARIGEGVEPSCLDDVADCAAEMAARASRRSLVRAINATGVILHTGLGRARLAPTAVAAIMEVASLHSILEIDRETGERGSRRGHVRDLLTELTGAEDALVLNNCAGALFLAVATLAAGSEVILSRGELVEIGGAFRMPDIVRSAGATLVEVGTTNRTRISDYAKAITERTALILRCHPSNFAIVGFTEEAPIDGLVALGRERGIPVIDDQGSGALIDPSTFGFVGVKGGMKASVSVGCDLVTASGDKLLGGPQAGLMLGRRDLVERAAIHPMARALRVDKLTLAGLEATLRLYRDPERAKAEIPTLRYLSRSEEEVKALARRLAARLRKAMPSGRYAITLVPGVSEIGGGSLPGQSLPTTCVAIRPTADGLSVNALARAFRLATPAVFGKVRNATFLLDPRTLELDEIALIAAAARRIADP